MNIPHLLKGTVAATSASGRYEGTAQANTPAAPSPGKNSVDLSAAARHLFSLQDGAADIDEKRVEQIRAAIASGELQIDPARIADGILASARELLK